MPSLRDELYKAINAAAAAERAKAAKAVLDETDQAIASGAVTREQLHAAIQAHEAVGDWTGCAHYKTALTRLVDDQRH